MKFRKIIIFVVFFMILLNQVFTNLKFSEILPNTDDDANLEYIELHNSGDLILSLSGYILKDKSGKEFIFNDTYILNPLEKKKYYRAESKILLNDTDEQLDLYDNFGNLIDTYSYTDSENGKVIIISNDNVDTNTGVQEENNTNEPLSETGSTNIEINTGVIETQSGTDDNAGITDSQTGVYDTFTGSNDDSLLPPIKYIFQSPSYLLEKDEILSVYNCDTGKEECKVNLDLSSSFTGAYKLSDFECEINFGFDTGEENKCNPATIIVPEGTFDVNIKIKSKISTDKFSEYTFKLVNKGYIKPTTIGGNTYINNVYTDISHLIIDKPDIIVQSGLNENNECISKKACSINLMYQTKNSKERCVWDFGGGVYESGIDNKCNPGYVKYLNGNYLVKLKVYEDGNIYNYNTSELNFSNILDEINNNEDKIVEQSKNNNENSEIMEENDNKNTDITSLLGNVKINKILPNPGSNDEEYVELINKGTQKISLKGCYLDDIIDGGSKAYYFGNNDLIEAGEIKKYIKNITKINQNNNADEVNLYCNDLLVDKLSWNFKVKKGYYLDHSRLDIFSGEAKVLEVIDGDTLKVEFLTSKKVENLRLIGIDTPETKNPNTGVQKYGEETYEYVKDNISGEDIIVEMDPNNFRDSYSRLLGFVYFEGESLNKKLIQEGYAKAYTNYDFKYKDEYVKAESVAKKNKLGIWAGNNDIVKKSESKSFVANQSKKLQAIIEIQGKLSSKKILTGNTITCFDTCSINFDGSNSTGNIKRYSWDFGNGKIHDGKNPSSIKYDKFGNYKVYLAVSSDNGEINTKTFIVNYFKSPKAEKKTNKVVKVEKKGKDNINNNKKFEQEEYVNKTDNNSIYFYIVLSILGVLLIIILLRKEKML